MSRRYWILSMACLMGFCQIDVKSEAVADIQIEIDPFGDDDEYYEEDGQLWIGPGFYYGVWFDDEYEYNNWYQRRGYYRDGGRRGYRGDHDGDHHGDHDGDHHSHGEGGHGGGGHGGGGHH